MHKMNNKILSFIYNKNTKKFLILKTNRDKPEIHGKSKWFTVTGSLEGKETYEKAVKREVLEETGLYVKEIYDLKWGCRYKWQNEVHEEMYFIAFVDSDKIKLDNVEVINYKWLNLNEFVKLIDWNGNKEELKTILKMGIKKSVTYNVIKIDDFTFNMPRSLFINDSETSYLTWHPQKDLSNLENVEQVYGICFEKDGRMLIVNTTGNWCLPGGTPEKDESFEETLKREVDEEADVEIDNLIPLGYNEIKRFNKDSSKKDVFYQLRYIAKIVKVKKQTPDPAYNKISKRRFINPKDFFKYCPWGRPAEEMIERAVKVIGKII